MSAPQFTPGPWWVFSARSIRSRHPQHKGCEVAHTTGGWGDWRRTANARLIAAAPCMAAFVQKHAEAGDAEAVALWERINGRA